MSGLGAWVFIAVVVLLLNRILTGASGRSGREGGPRGRSGPGPSGRAAGDLEAAAERMRQAGRPGADRQDAVRAFLRTVDDVLASRAAGAGAGASAPPSAGPRVAAPGEARPTAAARPPEARRAGGHGLGVEVGARAASGASPDAAAPPAGPPGATRSTAAGLPALPGRSRLQRAVLYAEMLGRPVTLKGESREPRV
ncbi:MAG TPA: hypothetical protein VKA44_05525 [Gemmatimonadota bacterium]|nr:hypothetical protein [Gemmatimonadota bacterium]